MRKKLYLGLAVALLLSMVTVGNLSAQAGLRLDGVIATGMGLVFDNTDRDAFVSLWSGNTEIHGFRFRLNGNYTNEAGNAGVRFRLNSHNNMQNGYLAIPIASGWLSFMDGLLRFDAGIVEDYMAGTNDWNLRTVTDQAGLGVLTKVNPIDGLNLGFGVYTLSRQGGGVNNVFQYNGQLADFRNIEHTVGSLKYVYSARYTMPDVFRVNATFRQKNNVGGDTNRPWTHTGEGETSQLVGDVQLLMIPNLTAVVAYRVHNINSFNRNGILQFSETFTYVMDDLQVGLNMMQWFYSTHDDSVNPDAVPSLLFNIWGQYALGNLVPRLDLFLGIGVRSRLGGSEHWEWHQRAGFQNLRNDSDHRHIYFGIRPRFRVNVDARSFIDFGMQLSVDSANYDAWNEKGGFAVAPAHANYRNNTDSRLSGVFFIDFSWSF